MPSPAETVPRAKGAATERRILDAGLALFAEQGFHGTTIPEVMAAAGVGGGSLYRLFPSKEALVNAVFRDAKRRLAASLAGALELGSDDPHAAFERLWDRLWDFARTEPVALRFLELQDHVPYLDGESRQLELTVLAPLLVSCMDLQRRGVFRAELGADVAMALVWGAFVGLVKAERLGYVKPTREALAAARDACWRALATEAHVPAEKERSPGRKAPKREAGR